jgi:hypothetical protein
MRGSERDTTDIRELTDRVMIDIFKKQIQEARTDPKRLQGTWNEAREILQNHFGKVSRIKTLNQHKLQRLYKTAIKESAGD